MPEMTEGGGAAGADLLSPTKTSLYKKNLEEISL